MDDTSEHRLPRLAPILLVAVLVWLAVIRPGNQAGDPTNGYRFATILVSVTAVACIAWRFHGILASAAAIILLRVFDPREPLPDAYLERGGDAALLAILAIGIAACSRQQRRGYVLWIALAIASAIVVWFGWIGTYAMCEDNIARDRVRHIAIGVMALSAVVGLLSQAKWLNRIWLVFVTLAIPAACLTKLGMDDQWRHVLVGGDWLAVVSEWRTALQDHTWTNGTWIGFTPWLAVSLVGIGLWRTGARGWREWRQSRAPIAWPLGVAGISLLAALGARPIGSGSLALAAIAALLTVFGIADLIQALVERIELKPPAD